MSRGDGAAFSHAVCRRAVAHVAGLAHRSRITQHLSNVALLRGDLAEATATMEEGLASGIADGSATWVTSIGYRLGMLYQAMGQLPEVTRVARAILRHTQDKPFFTQGAAYIFLGSVEYERNHLEAAEEAYKQAIATCVEADLLREVDPYMHFLIGHLQLAHIKRALGDPAAARAYLEQFAGHLSRRWVGGEVLPVVQGDFALLMRKLGDDQPGRRWLEDFALPAPGEPEPSHELYSLSHLRHLVYVRLALAYQRWQDAWPPLREQQALAERQGRVGSLIEWLILRALLAQAQGDSDEAIAAMARALSLGESSGYVRIFLDEGAAALALVRRVRSELHRGAIPDPDPDRDPDPTAQRPSTRYVDQLVADFTRERTRRLARGDTGRGMVEPLTAREREVLALIHDGLSNGEIAGHMVVAPSTVKSHVKAIYAKLGAESRTQALAQARKLNLL